MSPKQALTEWDSGLLDCCQDKGSCCYGFFCCPCLACSVAGTFGENRCLPLCDMLSPAVLTAFGIPLFAPPAALSLRVGIRNRYGVKGSMCNDILSSCFCMWCTWCQMHRELKFRKKNPTVINMQPAPL
ncbi:cornifelin homolog [Hippocampus zosterae]|uniref:cornifelin homolog n=1 Tax=Hippocampus zosterae TaxID=109293 RepID=UPI00223E7CCF|nr:cornifelin homolog [Hippocampus zosterae]XP_051929480.1 cornifelin homolog [Hippocampus zosterae]